MTEITNLKVASLRPDWAICRGFSLLFDNPGDSLKNVDGYYKLTTDQTISFYTTLNKFIYRISVDDMSLCRLPYKSYHVTVWDGINDGNLKVVKPGYKSEMEKYFSNLPRSVVTPPSFIDFVDKSQLCQRQWCVRFSFDGLFIMHNSVLVVKLKPSFATNTDYSRLKYERKELNDLFSIKFGHNPFANYFPHVSLGNFANEQGARIASVRLNDWNKILKQNMVQENIVFNSIQLYAFTDMATFVCSHEPNK